MDLKSRINRISRWSLQKQIAILLALLTVLVVGGLLATMFLSVESKSNAARRDGERMLDAVLLNLSQQLDTAYLRTGDEVALKEYANLLELPASQLTLPFHEYWTREGTFNFWYALWTGAGTSVCIWYGDTLIAEMPPLEAELWCELDDVKGVRPVSVDEEYAFAAHDHLEPALYQSVGTVGPMFILEPQFVVGLFVAQSKYQDEVAYAPIFGMLGATLGVSFAILFVLRRGLVPLRRLNQEVNKLQQNQDIENLDAMNISKIDISKYPTDLARLAEALNNYVVQVRDEQARTYNTYAGLIGHVNHTIAKVLRKAMREDDVIRRYLILMATTIQNATLGNDALRELTQMRDKEFCIGDVLRGQISLLSLEYTHVPVRLMDGSDVTILTSKNSFERMIGEILENACKYCKSKIMVTVRIIDGGERVEISIEDDGRGFPSELDKVWESGWREAADDEVKGAGLGLPMVRVSVRACSGEICLGQSEELEGARVVLRLPKQRQRSAWRDEASEQDNSWS